MSFLKRIKGNLNDHRRGSRESVTVDRRSLIELVEHFERLDSEGRAFHDSGSVRQNLHHAIEAMFYAQAKDSEFILLVVVETLKLDNDAHDSNCPRFDSSSIQQLLP